MLITMTSIFARNEDCPVREIGDGLVIMAPKGDLTHSLEDLGVFVWEKLDGQRTLTDILDAITAEYEVERDVAEADLRNFVGELVTAEIIVQL